jgi:hypothetical protein
VAELIQEFIDSIATIYIFAKENWWARRIMILLGLIAAALFIIYIRALVQV